MEPRQVAVLGGTGFIGQATVEALRAAGWTPRAFSRRSHPDGVPLDLASCTAAQLARAVEGCEAVVNLVGIKQERGRQTFRALHVDLVAKAIAACQAADIRRLVHVSVVASRPDARHAYQRTKWQGEELVRASGLDWTILRPSVVYGLGDDMVTHLARMVRGSPVFPVVDRGDSPLAAVDVQDVAACVRAALGTPGAVGRSIDVVGPERIPLAETVRRVAAALGERTWILPMPASLMRVPVAAMARWSKAPLSTPAQLRMLEEGLVGDGGAMRDLLGVEPRPCTPDRIRAILPPAAEPGLDLRLEKPRPWPGPPPALPLLSVLVLLGAGAMAFGFAGHAWDTWMRLVVALYGLGAVALLVLGRTRALGWRITPFATLLGLAAAGALYVVAWAAVAIPAVAREAAVLGRFPEGHSALFLVATLVPAVVAEELFWRGLVQRGLSARLPRLASVPLAVLLYTAAHLAGPPLVVAAAVGFGLAWALLYEVTRSLWAVVACHVALDLLLVVLAPVA